MTFPDLVWIMFLAGAAAYLQTITGFAFGLLMIGAIGLLGLTSLPDAATIVGILSLANSVHILVKGWRDVAWPEFRLVIGPSLVATVVGYAVLQIVAGINLGALQVILGLIIIGAGVQLLLRPDPLAVPSPSRDFIVAGAAGGLLGGLFATAGPPLVYHFYRQPMAGAAIRTTLVLIFAVGLVLRLVVVGVTGNMPHGSIWWCLTAIPAILVMTAIAKRWPPPLSPRTLRRLAFLLLVFSGLSLTAQVVFAWQ